MITRGIVILFLTIGLLDSALGAGAAWSYDGLHGPAPNMWYNITGYDRCGHLGQSPINIDTTKVKYDSTLTPITMDSYYKEPHNFSMVYANNKHSAVVTLTGDFLIHGGGLPYEYKAAQFHFHWGSVNTQGSEHTVNGGSYPMELHIVHYNTNWTSVADAADKKFGLAVLGFFFEIGPTDNADYHWLVDYKDNITYGDESLTLPVFRLDKLLPHDFTHYYRYEGSLTTPPCYESATWTVFHETIKISQAQLDSFRSLYYTLRGDPSPQHMTDNYRPVQPLNSRTIYTSTAPAVCTPPAPVGSASFVSFSIIWIGMMTMLAKYYIDSQ